jgi:hypothetical protein
MVAVMINFCIFKKVFIHTMSSILKIIGFIFVGLELNSIVKMNTKSQQVFSAEIPKQVQTLMESNCSTIDEKYFPLIKVQHSDEVHNSSFDLIESLDVVNEHSGFLFSITCVALYPIEWVVNYFYVSFTYIYICIWVLLIYFSRTTFYIALTSFKSY